MSGGMRLLHTRPRLQIETVPCLEEVVGLMGLVNGDLALADHFKPIALYDHGCTLVDTDTEQPGMRGDDGDQVLFALPGQQMLVDGDIVHESESPLVAAGHHDLVSSPGAAHQVRSENRGSGRAAADHTASVQHGPQ